MLAASAGRQFWPPILTYSAGRGRLAREWLNWGYRSPPPRAVVLCSYSPPSRQAGRFPPPHSRALAP